MYRYGREWATEYMGNLNKFFSNLKTILPAESLVVWNMTMPLGKKIVGGFLVPEVGYKKIKITMVENEPS